MSRPNQKIAKTKYYLGIDYGEAKIGLALADNVIKIAFAYKTLQNNKDLLQNLVKIVTEKNIYKIIIGIPEYINQERKEFKGNLLGNLIKKTLPKIEIEYQNEMFTTKIAQRNLIEKGLKNIKKYDDQEAAKIILQSWLDKYKLESL